eukprot:TRINITY_DN1525_c0_g2_i2.p1 TRINITY_DN1525_c0_g2~~TRINITY_DN1525_c0_g2_i2.p1  ORF type:complete len:131 (-),score=23.38 TRINITY_DN1525_c0_g2_i2:149-541(-)
MYEDPSADTKKELAEMGRDCVRDFGQAAKLLVRNSGVRENLTKVQRDFVAHDKTTESTLTMISKLSLMMNDLNSQTTRINQCFEELPKVSEVLEECQAIAKRKDLSALQSLNESYSYISISTTPAQFHRR